MSTRRDPQKREGQACSPAQLHTSDIRPADRSTLQSRGQLAKAASLEAEADRLQSYGAYPAARRARHQANQLRQLARGPRPETPVVDVERELAAGQLVRWAGRGAA